MNLCLPHFHTTVHCNKLCADSYDVTNLVSEDPVLRRRGFKLEYFLRPPVQVTLKFGFQVEIYRVDVELWPWGMDHGQARKMLEISTSSDHGPIKNLSQRGHQSFQPRHDTATTKDESTRPSERVRGGKSCRSNGNQWSLQAQQWGEDAPAASRRTTSEFTSRTSTQPGDPEPEFKLVGRCDLREEAKISFVRSNFSPSPLFPSSPPPPPPAGCRQEELWRRGPFSLGAVTQLRLTVPFASAASALGLKTLAVWGQPARCCPPEEAEKIWRAHKASLRQPPRPTLLVPPASPAEPQLDAASDTSIPEEFLDPITQEVMLLPMLLPSGVSVDNTTLEEHQKREATWGRAPNDPFTGVPFTSSSQPLPNPQLKGRIDQFLLQRGMMGRRGMLGRKAEGENLQASRLVAAEAGEQSQKPPSSSPPNSSKTMTHIENSKSGRRSVGMCDTSKALTSESPSALPLKRTLNQGLAEEGTESEGERPPQTKRQRNDAFPSGSSHEQRLSASLDEALLSALRGRPSFTSNLPRAPGPASSSQDAPTDAGTCSACSSPVSAYSTPASSIYRLTCGHLLCRSCLHRLVPATANHVSCPACQSPTPRGDVTRVHL